MQVEEFLRKKKIRLNEQQMEAVKSIKGKTLLLS